MVQQTFTRQEVRALLKRQLSAVSTSLGRMEIEPTLARHKAYLDELDRTAKRIRSVNIIKF